MIRDAPGRAAASEGGFGHTASVGLYGDQILPRLINVLLGGAEFREVRARVASGLEGEVLEVGFGSGLNVPYYPPQVRRVLAVDPATVGRKLAARRVAESPVPVEYVGLDGGNLPVSDGSVDHVLITWTMCTIPDIEGALGEIRRVLRPDGALHFAEHGRSPDAQVARWQDRLNPIQGRLAGGCHLNRPIDGLLANAGFSMKQMENYYLSGPKFFGYMYEGLASKT
jgi:SAM-dependent methyltransferase